MVSVVIPAYNAEEFIEEAIESVLAQSYRPIEVIVVDDGSTDSTSRRVKAFGDPVIPLYRENSGGFPGVTRNTGMARASGEHILFLDADDLMLPGRIQVQADFLRTHPEVGCVFGDYQNFSATGPVGPSHFKTCRHLSDKLASRAQLVLGSKEATALLLRENIGIPSSMALRRSVLRHVSGFPADLRIGEDFQFTYRIARQFSIGAIDSVLVMRRFHDRNLSGDSLQTLHDRLRSFAFLRESEAHPCNRDLLADRLHLCALGLARAYANRRQYLRALKYGSRAFRDALPRRPGRALGGLRSLLRTLAIAARLKEPAA